MDERGSHEVSSASNRDCRTVPSKKPAQVLPVLGSEAPFGWSPAVMPSKKKAPLGRLVTVELRRKCKSSYPILKAWVPQILVKSSRKEMVSLIWRLFPLPISPQSPLSLY